MQSTSMVVMVGAFVNLAADLANLATVVISRREACAVPKPARQADLPFYARRACLSDWSTCSWSGCLAGWRCWREAMPRRMQRYSRCGTRSLFASAGRPPQAGLG
jgi:hypothetical protein